MKGIIRIGCIINDKMREKIRIKIDNSFYLEKHECEDCEDNAEYGHQYRSFSSSESNGVGIS